MPSGTTSSWLLPPAWFRPGPLYTLEQERIQRGLIEHGVEIRANESVTRAEPGQIETACVFSGRKSRIPWRESRACHRARFGRILSPRRLQRYSTLRLEKIIETLEIIGDALAPGLIADAVFLGHLAARNFEADPQEITAAIYRRGNAIAPGSCLKKPST